MTTFIALLRAVNLPGHNKVSMRDLLVMLAGLGIPDAKSLLQSGNFVFRCEIKSTAQLERLLEDAAVERLGLRTEFYGRTLAELEEVIANNPFPEEAERDPGHLLVGFSKVETSAENVAALQKAIVGREVIRVIGRHSYTVYPDGVGTSKLTTALIERKLGTRGTARNWNTVYKLRKVAAELEQS